MATSQIEFGGVIDLIDQAPPANGTAEGAERTRRSRLNDVMIVLERARPELEVALRNRVAQIASATHEHGTVFESADVELDQHEPRFVVAVFSADGQAPTSLPKTIRQDLEAAIADEILKTIAAIVVPNNNPRWQLAVTATYRPAEPVSGGPEQSRSRRLKSFWLKALLVLITAVVISAIYLYVTRTGVI